MRTGIGLTLCLLLPALLLGVSGYARFADGWARDRSLPIPNYLLRGVAASRQAYADGAAALAGIARANGDGVIAQAEATIDAGAPPDTEIALTEMGVSDAPALARGWMLLAFSAAHKDSRLAGHAASLGYLLAPLDFWLAGVRARQAVDLWPVMDGDTREMALAHVRRLWDEPALRDNLMPLLAVPDGSRLLTDAFAGRQADLLELDRWVLTTGRARAAQAR